MKLSVDRDLNIVSQDSRASAAASPSSGHQDGQLYPLVRCTTKTKPFTPHDLRPTAATLAGDLGFDDAWIAKCLDHAASKKQEQIVPSVTGKLKTDEGEACGAGWRCGGASADHRQAREASRNRTASRRLTFQPDPVSGVGLSLETG
jgi:hypothetical protein